MPMGFIAPNWGESIGSGLSKGFDSVMQGYLGALKYRVSKDEMDRNRRMEELKFASETGYNPQDLIRGQQYEEFYGPKEEWATMGPSYGPGAPAMANPPYAPFQSPGFLAPAPLPPQVPGYEKSQEASDLVDEYHQFKGMLQGGQRLKQTKLIADTNKAVTDEAISNEILGSFRGAGSGKPTIVTGPDGARYVKTITRQGPRYRVADFQKGVESAVQNANDAMGTLSNVDDYFKAVEESASSRLAQANLPGGLRDWVYPDVAQKEADLFVPFIFSQGGKQLTINEKDMIMSIGKNAAFGPDERENARRELKKILLRRIKGYATANLTGDMKGQLLQRVRQEEKALGIDPGRREPFQQRANYLTEVLHLPDDQAMQLLKEEGYQP